jgi:HEAT repeat protein
MARSKLPTDVKALARVHTEDAIRVLAQIMNDPSAPTTARATAAAYLVSRVEGKAKSPAKLIPDNRTYYVYSVHLDGRLLYIGKGTGKRRLVSAERLGGISRIRAIFDSETKALLFEARLIRRFRPIWNIQYVRAG